jgi:hypothetical protein
MSVVEMNALKCEIWRNLDARNSPITSTMIDLKCSSKDFRGN